MADIKIKVVRDDIINAFAAYASSSIKDGEGIILLNIEALNIACTENEDVKHKETLIELLMHEFGHCLEEWYDIEFSEERVERLLATYKE